MHLKSDCIFKAVFGLNYSLTNSLPIWYDQSVLRIIWKIDSIVFILLMSRNCSSKQQKYEFWTNFGLQYLQWPSLAHEFFFIMWNLSRLSSNLCKNIHVQARIWKVVAISKAICIHFARYKYLHNGSSLRSFILIYCKLVWFQDAFQYLKGKSCAFIKNLN